jgi:negative regulator of sigma E activity
MDNELSKDELRFLLKGLETDSEGRDTWRRYHDIGDAMRDEPASSLNVDLSARVMAAIAEEEKALGIAEKDQAGAQDPTWMKRVVSFAVAASVATVAVFVANDRGLIGAADNSLAVTTPGAITASASPAARQSDVAEWEQVSPELQDRINRFLGTEEGIAGEPELGSQIRLVGHREDDADADKDETGMAEPALDEVNEPSAP